MARNISVGIDIGTYQIKVVVTESVKEKEKTGLRIIGTGTAESRGLRHGYIINSSDVTKSLSQALAQAESSSGQKIRRAFVSIGGIGLGSVISQSTVIISRADGEIDEIDLEKATELCEKEIPPAQLLNKKILHTVPLQYKLDGRVILGKPIGMKGVKFETKTLFIMCLEQHVKDLVEAVEDVGIEVVDVMASPLAASFVTLSKTQKIAGCVLANIGAETVSIVVFENNVPISLEVFPTGSVDITNDIALGFKIPLDEAEHVKLGGITAANYPRKKLDEIVEARLADIFELIEAHLKKIGRDGLLPAGIIITGGGGAQGSIEEYSKAALRLPSKVATIQVGENTKGVVKDSSWAVAYGLCIFGFTSNDTSSIKIGSIISKIKRIIVGWLKQFLP